jgi:hypothetical protein
LSEICFFNYKNNTTLKLKTIPYGWMAPQQLVVDNSIIAENGKIGRRLAS